MKNVLVTGIGGNVGQGILRNIRSLDYKVRLIGTDINSHTAGAFLCDETYQLPYSWDKGYINKIKKICDEEKVDCIIPSTDFEVYYLKQSKERLPLIIGSEKAVVGVFLDKYLTYQTFKKFNIPFAESVLPSQFQHQWKKFIVKPRKGRGSRNIYVSPENTASFSDEYVIQKREIGREITTAFYITKNRQVLGQITLERSLSNGMTDQCEVVSEFDKQINAIIDSVNTHLEIKGPCNIQSIVTKQGKVIPFEVNCRISGTNSIRSQFGFEDVKYCLQEYLFQEEPSKPQIRKGAAIRIMMDVIFPDQELSQVHNNRTKNYIF